MRNLNKIVTAITILLSFLFPLSGLAQSAEAEAWADKSLQAMSPDEKIGQLFMIAAYSNKDKDYEDKLSKLLQTYHIGGIIFFKGNRYGKQK